MSLGNSPYAELFLPVEKIFGTEKPAQEDISIIYRRKPTEPWLTVTFPSGNEKKIWCTFSEEQIDFTVAELYSRGSNINRKYSTSEYQNLDIYQIKRRNCSISC